MLFRQLLIDEFNARRNDFASFAENQHEVLQDYIALLRDLGARTNDSIRRQLGSRTDIGALPSDELNDFRGVTKDFEPKWKNHEEARNWALEILLNRVTFAADASQILPGREISLPVAAIQVGAFENPHSANVEYKKFAKFILIPPNELLESDLSDEKPISTETIVGFKRFEAEVETIKTFLESKKGWQNRGERAPLAFFDGTLLISISLPRTTIQNQFINKIVELVDVSRETKVPLIGFVDNSYARDLIGLLDATNTNLLHQRSQSLYDEQLLGVETLKLWGERTAFFYCQRRGLSDFFSDADGNPKVGFVYLQTTGNGGAARIDVPSWIYENGLLSEVLDSVCAECVIGLGYPYSLETADATAVITAKDREVFLRALQDFAIRENLNFRVANKRISKSRRR
ncbi:MAG: DNA double-strand break repair nuclease NurA [Pyrinomonadaceae bacterium]|nr:DNA double-strand break repair nuclease NurA [Pyrinomonadaceae bacterium]